MEDRLTKKQNPEQLTVQSHLPFFLSVHSYIGLLLAPSLSITDFCESRRHHRLEWKKEVGEGGREGGRGGHRHNTLICGPSA